MLWFTKIKNPKKFKNVKVYGGDPWYAPLDGYINDLSIVNGKSLRGGGHHPCSAEPLLKGILQHNTSLS